MYFLIIFFDSVNNGKVPSCSLNKSSTLQFNTVAIFNATTVDGIVLPFSIAFMLFLDTSALSDNSCCVRPDSFLKLLKIVEKLPMMFSLNYSYALLSKSSTSSDISLALCSLISVSVILPAYISRPLLTRYPKEKAITKLIVQDISHKLNRI